MGRKQDQNTSNIVFETNEGDALRANQFAQPAGADTQAIDALQATIDEQSKTIEDLQAQLAEGKNQLLRAHADMENIRSRAARDSEQSKARARQSFVTELLPVADSLEQALSNCEECEQTDGLMRGVELTLTMLTAAMEKLGIQAIDPTGEAFNPEFHEAMSTVAEGGEPGTVLQVFQKGYRLKERLIRPARVIVIQPTSDST